MDESIKKKPNLATILGVECETQSFDYIDYIDNTKAWLNLHVSSDGILCQGGIPASGVAVCECVNHPESIVIKPKLTNVELGICRSLGAKYVTSEDSRDSTYVRLWKGNPYNSQQIAMISEDIFQSVRKGEWIAVE